MSEDKKSPLQEYEKQWQLVEKLLNEGTISGYKIAVVETEKILQTVLNDKNFPGKDISAQIENARMILENFDKLNYSRAMFNKIIKESDFDISSEDTKEIIAGYYKAISDIIKIDSKDIELKEKINLFLQRYFYNFPVRIRNGFILVFLFLLAVFLSTETTTGKSIAEMVSELSQFIFYKFVPMILAVVVMGSIIVGGLYYWKRKK
ncbi:hypothetical protein KAI56_00315 [Candidatus Parcubacteria bacterium]|nr:hypothetical protein [Candidatus Parcubacteria bacterium]